MRAPSSPAFSSTPGIADAVLLQSGGDETDGKVFSFLSITDVLSMIDLFIPFKNPKFGLGHLVDAVEMDHTRLGGVSLSLQFNLTSRSLICLPHLGDLRQQAIHNLLVLSNLF